jgi:hypothetical protein
MELSFQFQKLRELVESGALESCFSEYIAGMYERVDMKSLTNFRSNDFESNIERLENKYHVRFEQERREEFKLIKEQLLRKEREHE